MEKSAITRSFGFRFRLLITIAALFAAFVIPGFSLNPSVIQTLSVKPNSSWFFVGSECGYVLEIPDVEPSQVQVSVPPLPDVISLLSLDKDEFINGSLRGTSVRIWFLVTGKGRIQPPSLSVRISGRTYFVPFEPVVVYDNPSLTRPELSVEIRNNAGIQLVPDARGTIEVNTADVLKLSVFVRFAANLTDFSWKLPRDSLFSELQRYPFTQLRNGSSEFTPNWEPIADFEWVPLVSGSYALPDIAVTVVSFGGYRFTLPMPPYTIRVLSSDAAGLESGSVTAVPELFSAAFSAQKEPSGAVSKDYVLSDVQVAKSIAALRTAERRALPLPGFRSKRILYEASSGIISAEKEPSVTAVLFFVAAAVLCGILVAFFALFRKRGGVISFSVLCVLLLVCGAASSINLWKDYGIFAGGIVRAVPENSVSGISVFAPGTRVEILSEAGKWMYIQADNTGGWVPSAQVFSIGGKAESAVSDNLTGGE